MFDTATLNVVEYKLLEDALRNARTNLEEASARLAEARKQGDISENAEFDAAKADIAMYSKVIQNLQQRLALSQDAEKIPAWQFTLEMSDDRYPGEHPLEFTVILTETTVRAKPFFESDKTAVFSSDGNSLDDCGMVTKQSKLGSFLSKFTSEDSAGKTFKYIDNKQVPRTFTIREVKKIES